MGFYQKRFPPVVVAGVFLVVAVGMGLANELQRKQGPPPSIPQFGPPAVDASSFPLGTSEAEIRSRLGPPNAQNPPEIGDPRHVLTYGKWQMVFEQGRMVSKSPAPGN